MGYMYALSVAETEGGPMAVSNNHDRLIEWITEQDGYIYSEARCGDVTYLMSKRGRDEYVIRKVNVV